MFHERGHDGRSVLGRLEVQVERDPKTGATVVRSVAPVSTPAGDERANTVFDDGRKSIHAVGGSGGQPSNEELGQILEMIDGVGMKALLDEVTVLPNAAETKDEAVDARGAQKENSRHGVSKEKHIQGDSSRSYNPEAVSVEKEDEEKDDRSIVETRHMAVDYVEDGSLEKGPVTLLFLGYTDATTSQDPSQEGGEGMLTAERVIITEDGEEYVVDPESPAPPSETVSKVAEQEAGKEVSKDVTLDGDEVQGEDRDKGPQKTSSPGKDKSKTRTCHCCSVM